jgi:acetoin:2,6-dichlorophenolindophenol oxidoreductase subunit alpha
MSTVTDQKSAGSLDKGQGLALYQTMVRIRAFEDAIHVLKANDELEGFIHLTVGQEAVDAGICAALRADDSVFTSFRNHGQCIAKGVDTKAMMAEMFGRSTGCCGGKGGSMHLADHAKYIFGGNGIVGSAPPLALGPALTAKTLGTSQVSVGFFGEGAAQQGVTHEAMNFAATLELPVVFVCTNNRYAQSTPVDYNSAVADIAARADGYAMPAVIVDGQSVLDVYEAARTAVEHARAGNGPSLIEAKTFLFYGAWEGEHPDSKTYRDPELEASFLARDPIVLFGNQLIESGWASREQIGALRSEAEAETSDAIEYARSSPWPAPEHTETDVYAPAS